MTVRSSRSSATKLPRTAGRVLSAAHVAAFCNVDVKTIHNWADRGKIPSWRTPGRHLRFRRLDVVDFLRSYAMELPVALRTARTSMVLVEGNGATLAALRRALSRRFEFEAYERIADALLELASLDPELLLLGNVSPLPPESVVAAVRSSEATRNVRVVSIGYRCEGVASWTPTAEISALREAIESVSGAQ